MIAATAVLEVVDTWIADGGRPYTSLDPSIARRIARLRAGEVTACEPEWVDRLLCAIGMPELLADLDPLPPAGRATA